MKNITLFITILLVGVVFSACHKDNSLPTYTISANPLFTDTLLIHQNDTVALGSTITYTTAGYVSDTTQSIYYTSIVVADSAKGTPYYTIGYTPANSSSGLYKITRTIGSQNASTGLWAWTANIAVPAPAGLLSSGKKVRATINFAYQLSLSSYTQGTISRTDGTKPHNFVYIK